MHITWIEPERLAASDLPLRAADIASLHGQGIRSILTLTERPLTDIRELRPALFERLGLELHHIPVIDYDAPTTTQAATIVATIGGALAQGWPLLVHCYAGIGRTGTALRLWYMAQGMSFAEARAYIHARRAPCAFLSEVQEDFLRAYGQANDRVQ